ncbi:Protein CBG13418 [Caenorhabditis briggsae]|uniref:Protein CBG13418 n=1 Tax=Caenorhabditis briggsae TaxID=6238 RepID=A8XHT4_CAEBR|nr:Protein CBG13418 [Caenorhabditis briggsae]CAP32200.2 Protein CBG13418 [Caenorhabditis briggsae]
MPGWFVIKHGEVDTSKDFDIVKDGAVSVSVSLDGDHICLNGHSDMFIVPESLCNFEVSSFVPKDICETLQTKGLHTLQELEGNYRIKISIASEGKKIVEFALPTGYKDLKMGMSESDDED